MKNRHKHHTRRRFFKKFHRVSFSSRAKPKYRPTLTVDKSCGVLEFAVCVSKWPVCSAARLRYVVLVEVQVRWVSVP